MLRYFNEHLSPVATHHVLVHFPSRHKLAAVVESGDSIHFMKVDLLFPVCCSSWEIALFCPTQKVLWAYSYWNSFYFPATPYQLKADLPPTLEFCWIFLSIIDGKRWPWSWLDWLDSTPLDPAASIRVRGWLTLINEQRVGKPLKSASKLYLRKKWSYKLLTFISCVWGGL